MCMINLGARWQVPKRTKRIKEKIQQHPKDIWVPICACIAISHEWIDKMLENGNAI